MGCSIRCGIWVLGLAVLFAEPAATAAPSPDVDLVDPRLVRESKYSGLTPREMFSRLEAQLGPSGDVLPVARAIQERYKSASPVEQERWETEFIRYAQELEPDRLTYVQFLTVAWSAFPPEADSGC